MNNTEDTQTGPPPWDNDQNDTQPSMTIPAEIRAEFAEREQQATPPDVLRYRSHDEETLTLQQDEISTPPPAAMAPGMAREAPPPRSSAAMRLAVGLCLILSIASLLVNGLLVFGLLNARSVVVEGLDTALEALDNSDGKGFHYDFKFEQEVPFSGDIPFKQDLVFPFEGDIPIDTTVEVPLKIGAQSFVVRVPINTSIYIDTAVPISIDQTFHVSTSIPVSMTIPVDIKPDDPMIQDLLGNVREWLVRLRKTFF
jgi:hypothetical protein